MRSPVLALTGLVWRRHRWGFAACAAVWLAMAALVQVVPRPVWTAGPEDGPLLPVHFVTFIGTFIPVLAFVVCAAAFTDGAAIEGRASTFPARLFLLPVPTRTLVFWPMAQGAATAALVWVAWNLAVLRPVGLDLPLAWPAVMAAVVTAWLQAVLWVPLPVPILRVFAAVLPATAALIPTFVIQYEAPPAVATAALAALLPVAYAVALAGVRRARRGETPEWAWPGRLVQAAVAWLPRRRADFASAAEAQAWFEWRLRGWALPVFALIAMLVWVPVVPMWGRAVENMASDEMTPMLVAAVRALSAPGLLLACTLAVVPLYAGALGTELGGVRSVGLQVSHLMSGCHPFVALRPLTERELVWAKWRMAARATLAAWAVVLPVVAATFAVTGKWRPVLDSPALQPYGAAGAALLVVAAVAGAVLATWLQLAGGMWVGLLGRGWLIAAIGVCVALGWVPLCYAGYWLWAHPDWLPALAAAGGVAVVLKLLIAAWLGQTLVRRGHLGPRELAVAAAAWVAAAAGYVALARALVPPERASLAAVALAVAVLMPFNPVVSAPLALEWGRHR